MAGMKTRYFHSRFYNREFQRLKNREQTFEVIKTTYTKKVLNGPAKLIFNNEGDIDNATLSLIGMVRRDAAKYIETNSYEQIEKRNIERGKINFFNMLGIIDSDDVISKVDVKSAYWETALMEGVVSRETDEKYKKMFEGFETKVAKGARLKALGSLATSKLHQYYEKGKLISEIVTIEPTKGLYMSICAKVDDLINELSQNVDGCLYYYWDCIFIKKEFEQEAIDFLRKKGYASTSQETSLQYMKFGNTGYIFSVSDNKVYMTRKETMHLIENIDNEEEATDEYIEI